MMHAGFITILNYVLKNSNELAGLYGIMRNRYSLTMTYFEKNSFHKRGVGLEQL